jgi:tRNA1Val (adenine37-N6)-methyltransferase
MRNKSIFKFKQFNIGHSQATMKVGTDGVLLGAWTSLLNSKRILDVGTGSGVIALMLAQRTQPEVYIDAIDLSLEDCEVAKENVAQSPWPEKIKVHHSALQNFSAEPYDLIVSNPPYFINSYKQDLLLHGKRLLHPNGRLSVILPETEAHHLISLSARQGWFCNRKCTFRSRANKPVERLLLELSSQPLPESIQELVLYQKDEVWSEAYQELTRDFYLKL